MLNPPPINNILAVIPAYNEEHHISRVVQSVQSHIPALVIDDGSMDGTPHLAEDAGAQVIRQILNQGKGAALRAGFRKALDLGCEAVITLDADGQHDPAEIPLFVDKFKAANTDLIIGRRSFRKMPLVRRISNTIGRWMFSWALRQNIPDNQSGYRLISKRLLLLLLDSRETGFEFEVEMIAICLKNGLTLDWVPIRTIYADESSHIQPLKHVWHYFRIVLSTREKFRS